MTNSDQEFDRLAKALLNLSVALGANLEPTRIKRYFHALRDLPIEAIEVGCAAAERECERYPAPVKLKEIANRCTPAETRPSRYFLAKSWVDEKGHWFTRKLKPGELPNEEGTGEYVTPGHAERAFPLIKRLAATIGKGKVRRTREEYAQLLADIDEMHRSFPSAGWDNTYHDLAGLWAAKGYLA